MRVVISGRASGVPRRKRELSQRVGTNKECCRGAGRRAEIGDAEAGIDRSQEPGRRRVAARGASGSDVGEPCCAGVVGKDIETLKSQQIIGVGVEAAQRQDDREQVGALKRDEIAKEISELTRHRPTSREPITTVPEVAVVKIAQRDSDGSTRERGVQPGKGLGR